MNKPDKNFLYLAVGAAFGLGSVLRFPALVLAYGGAFVAVYAAVCVCAALPLMCAELTLGRRFCGAFPLRGVCPLGGVAGGISAVNSAAICSCYGVIIALLAVRACTFYGSVKYGSPADMPDLTPVIAVLAFIALAFVLTRGAGVRSLIARISVMFQALLFAVLAARGLVYSNAFTVLAQVFAVDGAMLLSPDVWLAAFGQALLSLSLAAGVMPAFAEDMPAKLPPVLASGIIISVNFVGSLVCAAAALTLAAGGGSLSSLSSGALTNALVLYPAALSAAFSNDYICALFGCMFYCSLTFTAFVSALSLARPAYNWVRCAPISARTAALIICAAMSVACLPFAFGADLSIADGLCCNIVAPAAAAFELACLAYYVLTARRRRVTIGLWKRLNM